MLTATQDNIKQQKDTMSTYVESLTANVHDAILKQTAHATDTIQRDTASSAVTVKEAISNHINTANTDMIQQRDYVKQYIDDHFVTTLGELQTRCDSVLQTATQTATESITNAMMTVVTKGKADALDELKKIAAAAKTTMQDSKDGILAQANVCITELTESGKEGVEEYDIAQDADGNRIPTRQQRRMPPRRDSEHAQGREGYCPADG